MRDQQRTCTCAAEPSAVWDFLSDYARTLSLASKEAGATLRKGTPGEVGATYDAWVGWEGLTSSFPVRLVDAERPRRLVWESCSQGAKGSLRYDLEPADGGTKLTLHYMLDLGPAAAPLEPFAWALYGRLADRLVRKLHAHDFTEKA